MKGFLDAKYMGIPCYYRESDNMIIGRNYFYDIILSIAVWIDINIIGVHSFMIKIKDN